VLPDIHIPGYSLTQRLSDNGFSQAWIGRDVESGKAYFLKLPSSEPSISTDFIGRTLRDSYAAQKRIEIQRILTATALLDTDLGPVVVYPYLDVDIWRPVGAQTASASSGLDILVRAAWLTDFLHLRNLVHRDLKLSNFLLAADGSNSRMVLADLDLLCPAGRKSDATIMGTPGFIAPEIKADRQFTFRSDVYSLGRSAADWLDQLDRGGSTETRPALVPAELVSSLADPDPLNRPDFILDYFHRQKVLGTKRYVRLLKRLLWHLWLGAAAETSAARDGWFVDRCQNACRICGVPQEFIEDLQSVGQKHPERLEPVLRDLIRSAHIEKHGPYFHLELGDADLMRAYRRVGAPVTLESVGLGEGRGKPGLSANGSDLKRLLALKDHLEKTGRAETDKHGSVVLEDWQSLAELEIRTGRTREATELLKQIERELHDQPRQRLETIISLTRLLLSTGQSREARKWLEQGEAIRDEVNDPDLLVQLDLFRFRTAVDAGQSERALAIWDEAHARAAATGQDAILARCLYERSHLSWCEGDFRDATVHLRKAYRFARSGGEQAVVAKIYLSLQRIYQETADYHRSVRYGRRWRSTAARSSQPALEHYNLLSLIGCFVRLCDHGKVDYWLSQLRHHTQLLGGTATLQTFFNNSGWALAAQGKFGEAREQLYHVIQSADPDLRSVNVGKAYQNLAEIALMCGDTRQLRRAVAEGSAIFEDIGNASALAEIESLEIIERFYEGGGVDIDSLVQSYRVLADRSAWYYAVAVLFHILLADSPRVEVQELVGTDLTRLLKTSQAPLFRAVYRMITAHQGTPPRDDNVLASYKRALAVLDGARDRYRAFLLCERLGNLYGASGKTRLATKFLFLAFELATIIGHTVAADRLREPLGKIRQSESERSRVVDSMASVAAIFRHQDYDKALYQMLKFAVDELGAERGVLLLRNEATGQFEVRTAVHCDEGTLIDVSNLSRRLPEFATNGDGILRINDALADNRTKALRSVVVNNIRSVLAMPLSSQRGLRAVLYLDHHTVPALFDTVDARYLDSLAEFVAASLDSIDQQRVASLRLNQLLEEKSGLGSSTTFITRHQPLQRILEQLPQIAIADTPVLITGETGTGKEIIANLIHSLSRRADRQFVKVNISSLSETMSEAELFGIGKNVATGVAARKGKFEYADGGTLLLDEIGDMPQDLQAKILRCIEDYRFQRVGENRSISFDARLIYATNRDLSQMVGEGTFRDDLLYRIRMLEIELIPLRDRTEDIAPLIDYFVSGEFKGAGAAPKLSQSAWEALMDYPWPGNVRELKGVIESLLILYGGQTVTLDSLPKEIRGSARKKPSKEASDDSAERDRIRNALIRANWNRSAAARELNIPITSLRRRIRKYRLEP
jgi:transcriptional regulator with GAF, ATPase, and Fis domain